MTKRLLFFAFALLFSLAANAQFRYTFKDTTRPYVPLTTSTSVNGSTIWDDEDFSVPLPFTWKIDSNISLTSFELSLWNGSILDQISNMADVNGFTFGDMDLADRGNLDFNTTLSPIRYTTTGSTPNRIFKVELANAGFFMELDSLETMDDSVNLQVWIYETTNVVEFHYGPSRVSYPASYFVTGTGPIVGYVKHADYDMGTKGKVYFLKGNAATPTIDTYTVSMSALPTASLNSWPANGKVYRFTPRTTSSPCVAPVANFTAGTAVNRTVSYTYTGTTANLDSLVWNFGDGQRKKVTTGFGTPVTNTFAANGRYNVCVTAYNKCGSHQACKQTPLAIGDISALGEVRVYPNPAREQITIEGIEAGGKAVVYSVTGQAVLTSAISSTRQNLEIASLPAGTYMLIVSDKSGAAGSIRFGKQ